MNKRYKQKELKPYLHNNKINIPGLTETRVKEPNMKATIKGITPSWGIVHNYNKTSNGRIWVIWDESWYETILFSSTAQLLHFQMQERNKGQQIMLTVVYVYNTIKQRKSLWLELNSLAQGISQQGLIAGDFNALLSP
ncbi:hypothetical protein RDI58_013468 [Solanum bulbocastanum]|uniref:Endonuclease/exonuclease/phosphatase domain-containing protein n=1 Tax=Solanum bulbocastanum TaxID=147425 RepID=A0AAN8TRS1_SOLBU